MEENPDQSSHASEDVPPEGASPGDASEAASETVAPTPFSDLEDADLPSGGGRGRIALISVVMVLLVILAAALFLVWGEIMRGIEAGQDLKLAREIMEDTDTALLAVDDVVRAELVPALAPEANEASEQVSVALEEYARALDLLAGAYDDLSRDDKEIADAAEDALTARLDMLEEAPVLLDVNARAARSVRPAESGLEAIVEAGDLAEEAADEYNKQTKDGVTTSTT